MPEGDSIRRAATRLHAALAGRELTRSDLRVPRFATADLTGRLTLDVTPRGKHLLARFEGGLTLHSHLRMDGAWHVFPAGATWRGGPAHEIRAILGTAGHTAVGYRLPVLELIRTAEEDRAVGHLGPDLLGPDWDPGRAAANLLADPGRPSARPSSTSATSPGSATSTRPSSASWPRSLPGPRSALFPRRPSPGWPPRPTACWPRTPASGRARATPPAAGAPARTCSSTAAPTAPACAAAPPSARPRRTAGPPTGAPAANPARRPS